MKNILSLAGLGLISALAVTAEKSEYDKFLNASLNIKDGACLAEAKTLHSEQNDEQKLFEVTKQAFATGTNYCASLHRTQYPAEMMNKTLSSILTIEPDNIFNQQHISRIKEHASTQPCKAAIEATALICPNFAATHLL